MVVTVYTKPQCVQCNMTYRALDAKGINYDKVDITEEHWSGFQPDKINALALA